MDSETTGEVLSGAGLPATYGRTTPPHHLCAPSPHAFKSWEGNRRTTSTTFVPRASLLTALTSISSSLIKHLKLLKVVCHLFPAGPTQIPTLLCQTDQQGLSLYSLQETTSFDNISSSLQLLVECSCLIVDLFSSLSLSPTSFCCFLSFSFPKTIPVLFVRGPSSRGQMEVPRNLHTSTSTQQLLISGMVS